MELVTLEGIRATYAASLGNNTPHATPTDVAALFGTAKKLVKVTRVCFTVLNTAAGVMRWNLVKRVGGTQSAVDTPFLANTHSVQYDSGDSTSNVITDGLSGVYTGNPASVGTLSGIFDANTITQVANGFTRIEWLFGNGRPAKCPRLRNATEVLAINGDGHTLLTGEIFGVSFEWTEE